MHNSKQRTIFNDVILILGVSSQSGRSCMSYSFKDLKFVWEKQTGTEFEGCLWHPHKCVLGSSLAQSKKALRAIIK